MVPNLEEYNLDFDRKGEEENILVYKDLSGGPPMNPPLQTQVQPLLGLKTTKKQMALQ